MKSRSLAFLAAVLALSAACSRKPETPAAGAPTPAPSPAATPVPAVLRVVYAYDFNKYKLWGYDASGAALGGFTPPTDLKGAKGLVFNPANNTLYVCLADAIRTFDAATGAETSLGFAKTDKKLLMPQCLMVAGNTLFVALNNSVIAYNAVTGEPLATGFQSPHGVVYPSRLAARGGTLYVGESVYAPDLIDKVRPFDAATGEAVPGFTASTFGAVDGVGVSGNLLFVSDKKNKTVGEYDATTGAVINATLLGPEDAGHIAIVGNTLFVLKFEKGTFCTYELPAVAAPGNKLTARTSGALADLYTAERIAVIP